MTYRFKPLHLALAAVVVVLIILGTRTSDDKQVGQVAAAKSALTVTITQPEDSSLPIRLTANGNIAAWQEAIIGTETSGLRLNEVRVNVGDAVKRGQVLATFSAEPVQADLAQAQAAVAEAEATLTEATANAQRARKLQASGVISNQQINQYLTAELTAQARLEARRASVKVQQLRIKQAQIVAPDHGVISARSATVGAVLPTGQELFRMIRQGRLEWRAEVPSAELAALTPGMTVSVTSANSTVSKGTIRKIAPTVDTQTRNGMVYVDLPSPGSFKAGMFAHGEFEVDSSHGMTLPQSAVLLRDGFSYVLQVGTESVGEENYKVSEIKVSTGRRIGERIEITGGLDAAARVVASGAGFLSDGDTVHVVDPATEKSVTVKAPASTTVVQ